MKFNHKFTVANSKSIYVKYEYDIMFESATKQNHDLDFG